MTNKTARAKWSGDLDSGQGSFSYGHEPGVSETYTKESRFEEGKGVGPEDLIAAAHAGCYSMALSHLLNEEGEKPQGVATTATVALGEDDEGFAISASELKTEVSCPGLTQEKLDRLAAGAAQECPVSKALAGVEISVEAVLAGS